MIDKSKIIEQMARAMCKDHGINPDHTLGGDGQNFRWMEYANQARAAYSVAACLMTEAEDFISSMKNDPNAVHVNMLRGVIAKPTPAQIGHLYGGETAKEIVSEIMRQHPEHFSEKNEHWCGCRGCMVTDDGSCPACFDDAEDKSNA